MSIPIQQIKDTIYYRVAVAALIKTNSVRLSKEYAWPVLTFTLVTLVSCLVLLLSSSPATALPALASFWRA